MKNPELVYSEACAAGAEAAKNLKVTPMVINDRRTGKQHVIEGGPCGFAGIRITPARGKMVTYLKKQGIGSKSIVGGYYIFVREYAQSLALKEAYATAFARVLNANGVKCHPESRID
jgi:phosphoserine phosphatase